MKLSEGITAMKACLEMFGDVEFKFNESSDGNPAVELQNVDSANKPGALTDDEILFNEIMKFNARFPIKDLFIPSRN